MIAEKRKLFFSFLSTKRAHLPVLQHSCSRLLKPAGLLLFTFRPPCPKAELQGVEPALFWHVSTVQVNCTLGYAANCFCLPLAPLKSCNVAPALKHVACVCSYGASQVCGCMLQYSLLPGQPHLQAHTLVCC